jgi:hypothetical protein
MKVSDTKFLSWSQDPAYDDFPHNFRFYAKDQVFTYNYSVYDNWGGMNWSLQGTYIDDGEILTLNFTHKYEDGKLNALETPFTHTSPYKFVGNQVEFDVCVISSFLRGTAKGSTRYYWKDFVEHSDIESDLEADE